jgi:hypothetical protein
MARLFGSHIWSEKSVASCMEPVQRLSGRQNDRTVASVPALKRLAALLLIVASCAILAAPFESATYVLDVPVGFEGPISQSMGAEGSVIAFAKPHANVPTTTLLQISIFEVPTHLPALPRQDLGPASERYLGQFLGGIERRRSNFVSTGPTRVTLGGLPASRSTWVGEAQGRKLHGVMYCVIVDHQVFQLHTQDFDNSPPGNLRDAESSIKRIRFKRAS